MTDNRTKLEKLVRIRTPYQHPEVPFVVLWSQKSGCTSIFKWFLWHAGLLDEALGYKLGEMTLSLHLYEREVFSRGPEYKHELVERIVGGVPTINFMRCPYARAFSSYMHLQNRFFIQLERDGIQNVGLAVRKTILRSIYGIEVGVEYPFSFVDYLHWLVGQDPTTVEKHHALQWTPMYEIANVTHYRLEDFQQAVAAVERRHELPLSWEVRDQFSSGHHLNKRRMNRATILALLERGLPLKRSPQFEVPTVERADLEDTYIGALIEKRFAKDIELYDSIERV